VRLGILAGQGERKSQPVKRTTVSNTQLFKKRQAFACQSFAFFRFPLTLSEHAKPPDDACHASPVAQRPENRQALLKPLTHLGPIACQPRGTTHISQHSGHMTPVTDADLSMEILGDPSPELVQMATGMNIPIYSFLQGLG